MTECLLSQRIDSAIASCSHFSPRSTFTCSTNGGCVTLQGTVGSFYHKQLAQEVIKTVDGVSQIENQLEVMSR